MKIYAQNSAVAVLYLLLPCPPLTIDIEIVEGVQIFGFLLDKVLVGVDATVAGGLADQLGGSSLPCARKVGNAIPARVSARREQKLLAVHGLDHAIVTVLSQSGPRRLEGGVPRILLQVEDLTPLVATRHVEEQQAVHDR